MSRFQKQISSGPSADEPRGSAVEAMYTDFIAESNRIEGIKRLPTKAEAEEMKRFMMCPKVTVEEMQRFVAVYEPGARLRDKPGRDVQISTYRPPEGGIYIRYRLSELLRELGRVNSREVANREAYHTHVQYERLHPFTDCNGRSGRMLWAWQMQAFPLGFLHAFYYQALKYGDAGDE